MQPEKHPDPLSAKPAGAKPPPGAVPRVVTPASGKPRVVAKHRQPRVARRPLPPGFNPRFPDEVDFLTAQKPPPKWRTRYYAVAIVLHVALLTFLGYKMVYEPIIKQLPPPDLPAMKIVGDGLKPVGPENIPAPPAPANHSLDKIADAAPQVGPTPTVPRGITVPTHAPRSTLSLPIVALFNPKIPGNISAPKAVQGASSGTGADPYVGRRSGSSRGGAVRRYGGSDASEAAVMKALKWLKKNQNTGEAELGSWGGQYKVAMTGLALLAFLGHGETHESPEFEQTIKEALNFLAMQADQSQAPTSGYIGTARFEYQHPIATYALCEDYALTHYSALKPVCENAVAQIINAQRPDGSWDYDYNTGPGGVYNLKNRPSGDSSISAWNVQALVAAKNTGLKIAGLDAALGRSRNWFHHIYYHGSSEFVADEFSGSLTPRGLLEAAAKDGVAITEAGGDIDTLNALLKKGELHLRYKALAFPTEAEELVRRASSLSESERVRLNRLVLETAYPQKCPKKEEQGRFGYSVPDRMHSDALDGIGVLCLQLLGDGDAAEVKQTLPRLLKVKTQFRAANANSTYGWYYITQALFHAGGHWWAEWNLRLRDQLVQNQDADGSWGSPGSTAWQDNMTTNKVKGKDTRVYHTTLMCLALEVYYRFLPSFNIHNIATPEPPSTSSAR